MVRARVRRLRAPGDDGTAAALAGGPSPWVQALDGVWRFRRFDSPDVDHKVVAAGGPTPWDTWLTCEETTIDPISTPALTEAHGYVFEVMAEGRGTGEALRGLGRFSHEAAAVDPATSIVYLTEDDGNSGLFRFIPEQQGVLNGPGQLEMLAIGDAYYDTSLDPSGTEYPETHWVPIADPDPALREGGVRCYEQGKALGGARIIRGEGAWYADGVIWFISTNGGPAGFGQIFAYDLASGSLRVVYASTDELTLGNPDNVTVSPRGAAWCCARTATTSPSCTG